MDPEKGLPAKGKFPRHLCSFRSILLLALFSGPVLAQTPTFTNTPTLTPSPTALPNPGVNWALAVCGAPFGSRSEAAGGVFDGGSGARMWVIGGLRPSGTTLNDVWSSADGATWTQSTAAASFTTRRLHTCLSYNGKLWVIGGDSGSGTIDQDVWSSTGGASWSPATHTAAFGQRTAHGSVVFNNQMWVVGGISPSSNHNDVWSSTDGVSWTPVLADGPGGPTQFSPRAYFGLVVLNGLMWLIGGYDGINILKDVWSSSDGASWTKVPSSNYPGRVYFSALEYGGQMWVLGGGDDIWGSPDGAAWTQAGSNLPYGVRSGEEAMVFNNRIWVVTGDAGNGNDFSDSWYSPVTGAPTPVPTCLPTATVTPTPTQGSPTPTPTATAKPTGTPFAAPGSRPYAAPNPATGPTVEIVYEMKGPGTAFIRLWNAWGNLAASQQDTRPQGTQASQLDIQGLPPGHYFYQVLLRYDSGGTDKFDTQVLAVQR